MPVVTPVTVRQAVQSHKTPSHHGSHTHRWWRSYRFLNTKPSCSARKSSQPAQQASYYKPCGRSDAPPPPAGRNPGLRRPGTGGAGRPVAKWFPKAMCSAAMVHVVNHRYAVRSHLAHASDKRCALSYGDASFTNVTPANARHGTSEASPWTPPPSWPLNTGPSCTLHSRLHCTPDSASAEAACAGKEDVAQGGGKANDPGDIKTGSRRGPRCSVLGPWLQLCAKHVRGQALVSTVRVFRLNPLRHKRLFVLAPDVGVQPPIKAPGLRRRGVHGTDGPPLAKRDDVRTKHLAARDSWCLPTRYVKEDGAIVASAATRTVALRAAAQTPQPIRLQYVRFAHEVLLGYTGNPHVAKLLRSLVSRFVGRRLQLLSEASLLLLRAKLSAAPLSGRAAMIWAPRTKDQPGGCLRQPLGDPRGDYVPFLGYLICHGPDTRPNLRSPRGYLWTDTLSAQKKVLAWGLRNKVRLLVNMPKVLQSLSEQGFCDRSGNPQPNFHYFQETQSNTVARVASVLRGLANYYHLAESPRRCVSRWSYILTHSLAMMFAAKFKLGTRASVFAVAGRNLLKPLLAKSRLRDSSPSKHTAVPARAGLPPDQDGRPGTMRSGS
jgi:Type II intron maturase